ncbi:hypothetical protein [Thioflexithrix psekupsensis]|uniref:TIR domain-containing protein n=1 Tax=Thioflexithrix psekupsensis TaxID=1570016 RepID=A0A251XCN3_9GAMM|nr:hypothetical protein [Thioflexithrix psekupsensis]OUD16015.1 hypothetical protein TPSD3_01020 [Thioflexithrix psekupsensis]
MKTNIVSIEQQRESVHDLLERIYCVLEKHGQIVYQMVNRPAFPTSSGLTMDIITQEKMEASAAYESHKRTRVFINSAPNELESAEVLEKQLGDSFLYIKPLDFIRGRGDIYDDLQEKLENSDVMVIVLDKEVSYQWVLNQLYLCQRIKSSAGYKVELVLFSPYVEIGDSSEFFEKHMVRAIIVKSVDNLISELMKLEQLS